VTALEEAPAEVEQDLTKPFFTDAEAHRYRHINGSYGLAIVLGLRGKPVWCGTYDELAFARRRARNRVARRSRAINRSRK
jgi:hypothetical protein